MKYFEDTLKYLSDSIKKINNTDFEKLLFKCNDIINDGKKIIVSGLGKNVPICDKFTGTMLSLGMPAYFLHTNSAVHGDLGIVNSGDLVIILTKSGETIESIYLAKKLQELGDVELWLLTFEKKSTLAKMIKNKLIIELEHEGDEWNLVPSNSTTMNLIVLQELAIELARLRKVSIETFKRNHPGGHIGDVLSHE